MSKECWARMAALFISCFDPSNTGQNTAALLGKILRIDINVRSSPNPTDKKKPLPYGIPQGR